MTEAEWLRIEEPVPMMEFLKGKISDRKLRLFACGSSRHVCDSLKLKSIRQAVDTAERYADGYADDTELNKAYSLACEAVSRHTVGRYRYWLANRRTISADIRHMSFAAESAHLHRPFLVGRLSLVGRDDSLRAIGPSLLRDVVNPFRPVTFAPAWLTPTATALAAGIYADRAFDRLPVLADALEDAGCVDTDVLAHCRGPGPHIRGCWVVDMVLGKS